MRNTCSFHFNLAALLVLVKLREAKVSHLDAEVLVKKKVSWLEVTVDNLEDFMKPNNSKGLYIQKRKKSKQIFSGNK